MTEEIGELDIKVDRLENEVSNSTITIDEGSTNAAYGVLLSGTCEYPSPSPSPSSENANDPLQQLGELVVEITELIQMMRGERA